MEKEQIQDMAVQYATEGFSAEDKVVYDAWVISATEDEKQVFSEMVDVCSDFSTQGLQEVGVSKNVRANIFAEIDHQLEPTHEVKMIRKDEQEWINLPIKGAKLLELSARKEDGFAMSIIEVAPGTGFPEHEHHGVEMAYILEGDLEADGLTLYAGDFFRADAGSHHGDHISPSGCRALIVTANENYHHKSLKALGAVQKVYRKVKNVFAKSAS